MKFEDLIPQGKPLHELSDDEIQHIIRQLGPEELTRFNKEVRRASRPKRKSKKSIENGEDFDKALLKGMKK